MTVPNFNIAEVECTLDATGIHTILVGDDLGQDTGDYGLFVQRANDPGNVTPIAFGETIATSLALTAEMDSYTFEGKPGDEVSVSMAEVAVNIEPEVRIYRPDGTVLCSATAVSLAEAACTLDADGTHAVLAGDEFGDDVGDYELTLACTFPLPSCGPPLDNTFRARIAGADNLPPTATGAGAFAGRPQTNGFQTSVRCPAIDSCLRFKVRVKDVVDATMVHIHCALPGFDGPVGVTLYDDVPFTSVGIAVLADGLAFVPDVGNACGWGAIADVANAMRAEEAYIDVHTLAFPGGEIRGQIVPRSGG